MARRRAAVKPEELDRDEHGLLRCHKEELEPEELDRGVFKRQRKEEEEEEEEADLSKNMQVSQ